jgi:hypothetical protein
MTTITLKIKEKTRKGSVFLDLAKMFYDENNEVELVKMQNSLSKSVTIQNELTTKDKAYLNNLRKVVLDIKSGNNQNYKTWEEFANEV